MMSGEHNRSPTPPIGRRRYGRRGAWLIAVALVIIMLAIAAVLWTLFAPDAETPEARESAPVTADARASLR
jgi:uncharacterized membrane protein